MQKTDKTNLLPLGQQEYVDPDPIGEGNRMVVFKCRQTPSVLRVPKRTEEDLKVPKNKGNGSLQSQHTQEEIRRQNEAINFLGQFIAQVTPFTSNDTNGHARTYSHQHFIDFNRSIDLSRLLFSVSDMDPKLQVRMKKFIRKCRNMILATGMVPDLAGRGNVGVTKNGDVRLVDVNNIRDVVSSEWLNIHEEEFWRDAWPSFLTRQRSALREVLHADFLDEFDYPVSDMSLIQLQNWELALGTVTEEQLPSHPIYGPLQNETRQRVLRFLVSSQGL